MNHVRQAPLYTATLMAFPHREHQRSSGMVAGDLEVSAPSPGARTPHSEVELGVPHTSCGEKNVCVYGDGTCIVTGSL